MFFNRLQKQEKFFLMNYNDLILKNKIFFFHDRLFFSDSASQSFNYLTLISNHNQQHLSDFQDSVRKIGKNSNIK